MKALNWKPWVLATITLLCILAPRSLSFLPFIPAFIGYIWLSWQTRKPLTIDLPLAVFFAIAVTLAGLSSLWAVYPDIATDRALNTACIFLGGLVLLTTIKNASMQLGAGFYALIAGYIAIGLYLFADYLTYMKLSSALLDKHVDVWNFNRTLVTYVLLFVPMAVMAAHVIKDRTRKMIAVFLISVAVFLPLWQTSSQTAQVAFALAIGAYASIYFIKAEKIRKGIYALSGLILTAVILTAPLIPAPLQSALEDHTEKSVFAQGANADGRLEIWNFVSGKIMEKPLLGHGVEATRNMKSEQQMPVNKTHAVLHPHNAYLQIWVELGLAGASLASVFALFILFRISKAAADVQPVYFSLFTSLAGTLAIGYGFWQSWQIGMIFALCAFALLLTRIQKA